MVIFSKGDSEQIVINSLTARSGPKKEKKLASVSRPFCAVADPCASPHARALMHLFICACHGVQCPSACHAND